MTTPDGFYVKRYFDDLGKFTLNIPKSTTVPYVATFDTYDLKLYLDLTELQTEQVFTEPWTTEAGAPPPPMEQVFYEPWTVEYEPPLEMVQVFYEPWSEYGVVLKFYEPWTYYS